MSSFHVDGKELPKGTDGCQESLIATFFVRAIWVTYPKVSLHGGLQLGLRFRDGGSMEVQSLRATGKVSARELGYEILFV